MPVGAAKFGAVSFDYSPKPVGAAGNYTMTASVAGTANYTGLTKDVAFTIAARSIVPGGEDDPEKPDPSKPLPPGAVSKFDFVGMYDGAGHTVDTNAMRAAYVAVMGASVTIGFVDDPSGAAGVRALPPTFRDVVATSFWYKVSAANYNDVIHSCKVIVTNRPVTVTSGTKLDFTYDGQPHSWEQITICPPGFVAGEGIATSNWATVTTVAEGQVDNTFDYAPLAGTKLENYGLTVVTGKIAVAQAGAVTVTITGRVSSVVYDGTKKSVSGYDIVSISNPLYKQTDFRFDGLASTNGTDAGTYPMGLKATDFVNTNRNFSAVTFDVTDGELVINQASRDLSHLAWDYAEPFTYDGEVHGVALTDIPAGVAVAYENITNVNASVYEATARLTASASNYEAVDFTTNLVWKIVPSPTFVAVTVRGNCATNTYDGAAHTAKGYSIADDNELFDAAKSVTFSGSDSVSATDAGTYSMGLVPSQFTNSDGNFSNVVFKVTDGELVIQKATHDLSKLAWDYALTPFTYDGNAHGVALVGVPSGVAVAYENITNTASGAYEASARLTASADNYEAVYFTTNLVWEIVPSPTRVTVTVVGTCVTNTYDGVTHTAKGYALSDDNALYDSAKSVSFSGTALVTATDAGTCAMGLADPQFANSDPNFTNVVFEVTDGELVIQKATYDLSKVAWDYALTPFTYDGNAHGVSLTGVPSGVSVVYANITNVNAAAYEATARLTASAKNYESLDQTTNLTWKISPREGVVVTVVGNCVTNVYDGKSHMANGYTLTDNSELYDTASVNFTGTDSVTATDAGTYAMGLTADDFVNTDANFTNVVFDIADGELVITPRTGIVVSVRGRPSTSRYNGKERTSSGYALSTDDELYDLGNVTFSGTAIVSAIEVGTYKMGLESNQFANADPNFADVEFAVTDGYLVITKAVNEWLEDPWIWNKKGDGKPAEFYPGTPKYGVVIVTYDDGTDVAPVSAGRHTAIFTVPATESYDALTMSIVYEITGPASAGGKSYDTVEEAVAAANSQSPVTFVEKPAIDEAAHAIVTADGKSVSVPEYYDMTLSGKTVSLTLNAAAVPEIAAGKSSSTGEDIPAFDPSVGTEGEEVGVGTTTKKGLYYALEVGISPSELSLPSEATWVAGDGGIIQLRAEKPKGGVGQAFYRVTVSDVL